MKPGKVLSAIVIGAAILLLPISPAMADDGGRPLSTTMTGAAERPGPGDPDGTGTAVLQINPGQEEICYTLTVSGLSTVVAAHIHRAPVTSPGPIVVPLVAPVSGSSSACATVTRDLAIDIMQNPENYYVNVHTTEFPAGAIRGQLG